MNFSEKIKYLKEKDVDVEDIEKLGEIKEDSGWQVCFDDITDPTSFGDYYPIFEYFNSTEEAMDFAIEQINNKVGVEYIAYNF